MIDPDGSARMRLIRRDQAVKSVRLIRPGSARPVGYYRLTADLAAYHGSQGAGLRRKSPLRTWVRELYRPSPRRISPPECVVNAMTAECERFIYSYIYMLHNIRNDVEQFDNK